MRLLTALLFLAAAAPAFAGLAWEKTRETFTATPGQVMIRAAYPFKNTGNKTVTITGLVSSCSCTTAGLTKTAYAPGEGGAITAAFAVGERTGLQTKTIRVTTDDGTVQELVLQGEIPELLRIQPPFVYWKTGSAPEEKTVELEAMGPLKILSATSGNPDIEVRLEPVEEGKRYRLHLKPKRTSAPLNTTIELKTDPAPGKGIRFRVFAGIVQAEPVTP